MFTEKADTNEKKDITLRGVNKELYNRFSADRMVRGTSAGEAFSELVYSYLREPWRLHGFRKYGRKFRPGVKPEKVSDIEELYITKKDLTSAGEKTMFLFRNIKKLTFAADVDGTILAKHVKLITQSPNTTFEGKIPELIKIGLIRKQHVYVHPKGKDELKDITIRNVSAKIYDEFVTKAKAEETTTGEYFSRLLAHLVPFSELLEVFHGLGDKEVLFVSNEEDLTITKEDLEVLGERQVIFFNTQKLIFSDDIDQELFLRTVIKIVSCSEVKLPTKIPRLIILSRTKNCQKTNIA